MGKAKRVAAPKKGAALSSIIPSANGIAPRSRPAEAERIRALSDRLVEAQRPIRILDAIKWDESIERAFFAARCRELPSVRRDYYRGRPLPFDLEAKRREFAALERDIRRQLGKDNAAGQLMRGRCAEYRHVVDLLAARGTPAFGVLSAQLYGSAADRLRTGAPQLAELGRLLAAPLDHKGGEAAPSAEGPLLDAATAVRVLAERLAVYFPPPAVVRVRLSDGIISDATAGGDCIKLRADAVFSLRDLRLLEVHEGWVHLGTTLNGQQQPVCTFLSKGAPSCTATQEGLAVLIEVLSLASHPARIRRLAHRVAAVAQAEAGGDFLDVYRFFMSEGYPPRESYRQTVRIFRGSLPTGAGPYTKDLCYSKGFVQLFHFLRQAVASGQVRRLPLLFCGKTNLDDMPTLTRLAEEELLTPPRHVPPPFANLPALSAWLCYADFFGRLSA